MTDYRRRKAVKMLKVLDGWHVHGRDCDTCSWCCSSLHQKWQLLHDLPQGQFVQNLRRNCLFFTFMHSGVGAVFAKIREVIRK